MAEPKPTVLVPLYIWPVSSRTWKPLFDAASRIIAHPQLRFLVIVNPNSGPGDKPLPGRDYEREVPKLNAHANVVTVGYVRIHYCEKPIQDVCAEIDTYARWPEHDPALRLKGIMLDETPNHYSTKQAHYLDALRRHIKAAEGLGGQRLVLHNPGTPPDIELSDESGPDIVLTCEEPYERFKSPEVQKRLRDLHHDRARSGYQISGVPIGEMTQAVAELCKLGAYIFATDLVEDFYESFGQSWPGFVTAMEKAGEAGDQEASTSDFVAVTAAAKDEANTEREAEAKDPNHCE